MPVTFLSLSNLHPEARKFLTLYWEILKFGALFVCSGNSNRVEGGSDGILSSYRPKMLAIQNSNQPASFSFLVNSRVRVYLSQNPKSKQDFFFLLCERFKC